MRSTCLLPLVAGAALCGPAAADILFNDFTDTTGLNLEGLAARAGDRLRVCPALGNQSGAAWFAVQQDVASPWTSQFELQMFGGESGLAFVIQGQSATYLGSSGAQLGYGGIGNSLAIEFDTHQDLQVLDPSDSHVSVHSGLGQATSASEMASLGSTSLVPLLDDGQPHTVRLVYVPGSLAVYVDDLALPALQVQVDLGTDLGLTGGQAWVGFTASTGSSWQSHDVLSWSFDEQAPGWSGNHPPGPCTIAEPVSDGLVVSPFDVHLEVTGFSDPDAGDVHACTDWEIWTQASPQRVWRTSCSSGPILVHTHLADGVFEGSHAGQSELNANTAYVVRMRLSDDSGDPATAWGPWTERPFQTGDASTFYPLVLEDVRENPEPSWTTAAGQLPVVLPAAAVPPQVVLESVNGDLLLSYSGLDGVSNAVSNPAELAGHVTARLRVEGGSAGFSLPQTDLELTDEDCRASRVLLPDLTVAAGQTQLFWLSADGSSWFASPAQTEPDFSSLARGLALPWVAVDPGYVVEVVAGGFTLPVNIVAVPNPGPAPSDPFLYVAELYGTIKVIRRDGSVGVFASGLLNFNPTGFFPGSGEQGVGGLALDPATGDLFAGLLYDAGGPHYPKVIRLQSTDGGQTASTITTILDMAGESQGQSHFISNMTWLPTGELMVHMGDGFDANTAQNIDSFRGKALRLLPDGSPSPQNPMFNPNNGISARDYLFAWGLRNPFGGARRDSDGLYVFVENGPNIDRLAALVEGRNYLWNGADSSMTNFAAYNWLQAHAPVQATFVEAAKFNGSDLPVTDYGDLFVTESGPTYAPGPQVRGKRIVRFELSSSGSVLSGPSPVVEYAGTGRASAAGIVAGQGGLYFSDLYNDQGPNPIASGARILRLRFAGGVPDCGVGTSYCGPAASNSTGQDGILTAQGSLQLADNDLLLTATHLPPNQFGYLLASETQGFVIQPGGSQGNLCLGGTIGRYVAQVQGSGASGRIDVAVDLTDLPGPLQGGVHAGETWSYQLWYRDVNPWATSNFTQGVEVTFQ